MKPKILSFFTGAGLLDIGAESAGFDVVWRNEAHIPFVKGFQYGMSKYLGVSIDDLLVNTTPIEKLKVSDIINESRVSAAECVGMIGGPPCPDFSVGGKNKGKDGDNGKLTGVYFNLIKAIKPTFFLFENVKGILSTQKHRNYVLAQLHKVSNDFYFDLAILNSLDFGAPQDRQRVFVVGVRKKFLNSKLTSEEVKEIKARMDLLLSNKLDKKILDQEFWFPWPKVNKYYGAKKEYKWPITNPFGSKVRKPNGVPRELCIYHCFKGVERLANQKDIFTPISEKFLHIEEGDVSRKSFKRLHRWRYSPTAAYGNNEVHLHPCLPRRISVREAMRIQTVPDSYELPESMTLTDKFKTIGNGVPVVLSYEVMKQIKTLLRN